MVVVEIVDAYGHENVLATHGTTFEITKQTALTKRGDCVIATGASKGAKNLSEEFKKAMKRESARVTIIIDAGEAREVVVARGSPQLLFTHPTDMVVRKSSYACGRTIAIEANKSARDFSMNFVEKIQSATQSIRITLVLKNNQVSASTAT